MDGQWETYWTESSCVSISLILVPVMVSVLSIFRLICAPLVQIGLSVQELECLYFQRGNKQDNKTNVSGSGKSWFQLKTMDDIMVSVLVLI